MLSVVRSYSDVRADVFSIFPQVNHDIIAAGEIMISEFFCQFCGE